MTVHQLLLARTDNPPDLFRKSRRAPCVAILGRAAVPYRTATDQQTSRPLAKPSGGCQCTVSFSKQIRRIVILCLCELMYRHMGTQMYVTNSAKVRIGQTRGGTYTIQ